MSRFSNIKEYDADANTGKLSFRSTAACDTDALKNSAIVAIEDAVKLLCRTDAQLRASKLSPKLLRYAHRYFLTDEKNIAAEDLAMIKVIVTKIWTGLKGDVVLKVGTKQEIGARGSVSSLQGATSVKDYHTQNVRAANGEMSRFGAIKISGDRLEQGRLGVKTLIHEASHKYAGTMDYVYFRDDGETARSTFTNKYKALANADSYGWFVLKVGRTFFNTTNMMFH